MAFTRDELAEFEKQPAKVVDDTTNPFPTPADDQPNDDPANPSGAAADPPPDDSGDGTSGENDAPGGPPNPDPADPDGESDTTATVDADGNTVEPPPKKGSAKERIHELIDERDSYRSYGEFAQEQIQARDKRLAEIETELKALKQKAQPTSVRPVTDVDEPIPTLDDPDIQYDPEKLQRKLATWRDNVKKKAQESARATAPTVDPEAEGKKVVQEFSDSIVAFTETHKDFADVVKLLPPLAAGAARLVVKDKVSGAGVLYWLGQHKGEAVRIARLPEDEQVAEIGAIRAQLRKNAPQGKLKVIPPADKTPAPGASVQAKPKSASNAPPPPSAVRGGSRHDQVAITDPNLSMDDFVRRDRAEKLARREASKKFRGTR